MGRSKEIHPFHTHIIYDTLTSRIHLSYGVPCLYQSFQDARVNLDNIRKHPEKNRKGKYQKGLRIISLESINQITGV